MKVISDKAKRRANKLHKAEHMILDEKAPNHKAEYYYYMACQLIEDVLKEMRELSKQTKYLWQSLDEMKGGGDNGKNNNN